MGIVFRINARILRQVKVHLAAIGTAFIYEQSRCSKHWCYLIKRTRHRKHLARERDIREGELRALCEYSIDHIIGSQDRLFVVLDEPSGLDLIGN